MSTLVPISVTVNGPNHSGKTHILAVIQNALEQAGIPSNGIIVQGCDNSPQSYAEIKAKVAQEGLPENIRKHPVHLAETYHKHAQ